MVDSILISKYVPDDTKLINFCIPTYKGGSKLEVIINCLLAQNRFNHHITIVSDGEETETAKQLEKYFELPCFSYYHTKTRYNDYGHTPRLVGLHSSNCKLSVMTGFDNYYVPLFVEIFEKTLSLNPTAGLLYCDFVLDHIRGDRKYNGYMNSALESGYIDMGSFAAETSLMKRFGLRINEFAADWLLVKDITEHLEAEGRPSIKIPQTLYVHN